MLSIPQDYRSESFDDLVGQYERKVYNLIFRLVGDRDDAADLTQETFVAAFRAYPSFRGESSAYTWLCRIAINRCKNRFRDRDRQRGVEALSLEVAVPEDSTPTPAPAGGDPARSMEQAELRKRVEVAIGRLPDDYRIVVVLRDLDGLAYQEIAEATGLSLDVVKTRLARGRAMLRRSLEPYLIAE
jgi:RNA polymerase sigma-70 factor, ECF subfamily